MRMYWAKQRALAPSSIGVPATEHVGRTTPFRPAFFALAAIRAGGYVRRTGDALERQRVANRGLPVESLCDRGDAEDRQDGRGCESDDPAPPAG
jgi:hypothetical protein